jgi:tripartite-type tricarboxylate transporter receptor subunit TctC
VKDFVGVTQVASTPLIMVTSPTSEYKSVKDLIEAAKARPGVLTYCSAGAGSTTGIAGELFKQITNISMVNLAVRGLPETHTAVIRGDVAMGFTFFNAAATSFKAARCGPSRLPAPSASPGCRYSDLQRGRRPEFEYDSWFGILAPAGTPRVIVAKVSADISQSLQAADVKSRFEPQGMVLISSTPEKFDAVIKATPSATARSSSRPADSPTALLTMAWSGTLRS